MADSGLMGEVLSSLQTELLATLKGVELRSVKAHLQEAGQCQMVRPFRKEAIISDLKKYLYTIYILDFLHNTPHIIERYHLLKIGGFWSLIHGRNFTQSQYNLATMHSIIQKS